MSERRRRAKIVATVGPASSSREVLGQLVEAGVDVVRLNQSHGKRKDHEQLIALVREVAIATDRFVGVLVDLMGPRFRLGVIDGVRELSRGDELTIGDDGGEDIPLDDADVVQYLRRDERVLIDNGLIEAAVVWKRGRRARLRILSGGSVSTRKGINLPDSDIPFSISRKDRLDARMAVECGADFVAASYVGSADDVRSVRKMLKRLGGEDMPIIAKLERARAVDRLDEIIEESDAVMVARGDLGVEMEPHQVPVLQKRIIDGGWRLGKPVIVATQMLESMMEHPRPTRAESSDVANAVFDRADAMMLSGETAAGRYPVQAVQMMDRIIREAEEHLESGYSRSTAHTGTSRERAFDVEPPRRPGNPEIAETIALAAVVSALRRQAKCIVVLTQGGFTARMLSSRRPSTPVIALTQSARSARRLQIVWSVQPVMMKGEVEHHDEVVGLVDRHLLEQRLVDVGDEIAILMGDPIRERPPTNLLRLHRVRRPRR